MKPVARARIAVWEGGGLWFIEARGGSGEVPRHAHHAIQITFLIEGAMTIGAMGAALRGPIVAIDADAEHRFELDGSAALLFIDPESADGRAVRQKLLGGERVAPIAPDTVAIDLGELRSAWNDRRPVDELARVGKRLVRTLAGEVRAAPTDARVARIIDGLAAHLEAPPTLDEAARSIHLSPSRSRHLFVEQTGLPFKSYILWRKLMKAVEMYSDGASLTEAAHAAGFADSAHFSRTCRRMFGLPASALDLV